MTKNDLMIYGWENSFTYSQLQAFAEENRCKCPTSSEYLKFCLEQDAEVEDFFDDFDYEPSIANILDVNKNW